MTREDDVKALTYDLSPSESEGEEQKGEEEEKIQIEEEKHEIKKDKTTTEKKKESKTKGKMTKIERKKTKSVKTKTRAEGEKTKQEEKEIKIGREETKPVEEEKAKEQETEAPKAKVSPETLEREATTVPAALSTPIKPKGKKKRQPSMYFKAQKRTRIKMGKPQPPSKEPIIIGDSPVVKKKESPSKTPITSKRGSSRASTWRERIKLLDSKTFL